MTKIYHKNEGFSGVRVGVMFHQGKAIIDGDLTDAQRFHFKRWGYTIDDGEGVDDEASAKKPAKK